MAHSPTRRERCGSRRRALRHARRQRAERARDVHRRDGARGCRKARVKRFSRRRAHAGSAVMPHTSWGAWWPPLHAVHGGEGYDGESEITDIAFLKRKRDDAKGALRARGEPLARRSRCKHRECVSTSARMPNARSRGARTRADNPVHPARREPARVEARDILKYLRSRERGADASKPRMQCVPRSRRPTSVMSHHLHPTRVFARKKQTTTRAPLTETPNAPREMRDALQTRIPYVIKVRTARGTRLPPSLPPNPFLRSRVRPPSRSFALRTSFPRRDPNRDLPEISPPGAR